MFVSMLVVFVAMVVVDFMWARYLVTATAGKAMQSALWSIGIVLSNGLVVIEYTTSHWMILAAAVGSFVGTYVSVRFKKVEP